MVEMGKISIPKSPDIMNRSWRNTSNNSSSGFVYFNTSNSIPSPSSQNSLDTNEFLSFGSDSSPGGSPHGNQFSPSNYSSPRKHYSGKSPRQRGGRNQYYSPIQQTGGKHWRRNIGLTGNVDRNLNTTNNYFGENQHSSNRQHQTHHQRKNFNQNTPNQSYNSSAFYDQTCLQDPWADLEQKLINDRKKQDDSLVGTQSSQVNEEAKEASSGESGSEDDSEEMEESFS